MAYMGLKFQVLGKIANAQQNFQLNANASLHMITKTW